MSIVDFHAHIFPDKIASKAVGSIGSFYDEKSVCDGTAATLVARGGAAGIGRFVVHSTATKPDQARSINDFILSACAEHPEFVGFGTVHPAMGEACAEIERFAASGLRGLKLHPDFQRFQADDPSMDGVYDYCASAGIPILFHAGDKRYDFSGPRRLLRVLEKHPRLTMIAAHFGGWSEWEESLAVLAGRDLWFDTSSSLSYMDSSLALAIIKKHGASRILFGTDYPMWDPAPELRRVLELGLPEADLDLILHRNAEGLLGL